MFELFAHLHIICCHIKDGENILFTSSYFWSLPLFLQTFHKVANGCSYLSLTSLCMIQVTLLGNHLPAKQLVKYTDVSISNRCNNYESMHKYTHNALSMALDNLTQSSSVHHQIMQCTVVALGVLD